MEDLESRSAHGHRTHDLHPRSRLLVRDRKLILGDENQTRWRAVGSAALWFLLVAFGGGISVVWAQGDPEVAPRESAAEATAAAPSDDESLLETSAPSDAIVQREVIRRLRAYQGLEGVVVEVQAGVVRLSGEVLSLALSTEAESLAKSVDGVVDVLDQTEVVRDPREVVGPVLLDLLERLRTFLGWLPLLVVAFGIIGIFVILARWVGRWSRVYRRLSENPFVQDLWRLAFRSAILLTGILIALELLDATALVGAVLGTAGVAGLAIGFAFRDAAENFIAGILMSFRQPFLPNDHVAVDGHEGKVLRLTSRATILLTLDGNHLRIPNAKVFNSVLINYTRNPLRRFHVAVGVGTDEDLLVAQRLGVETLFDIEGVVAEPAPTARIVELGDSSVTIHYFGWVDQREFDFSAVKGEAMRRVKTALEDAGMDLPEPIYRVRMAPRTRVAKEPPKDTSRGAESAAPPPSTRVDATIDERIDEERRTSEDDLLSTTASLE
ncbi:MAG: mechanosensitive ion channel family protein [Thermoanaerobaculia bacterium]|nr:mechanosensitive ion channel family protein [Thermoanaerobaculia bacterium]